MTSHHFFVIYSVVIFFDIRLNSLVVNNTPDLTSQMTKYLSGTLTDSQTRAWTLNSTSLLHQQVITQLNHSVSSHTVWLIVMKFHKTCYFNLSMLRGRTRVWMNLKMDSDVSRRWKAIKASVLPKLGSLTLARPKPFIRRRHNNDSKFKCVSLFYITGYLH